MQKIIEKAGVLIEALPYIQRFHGEIIVVKFGGSAMENPRSTESILADVTFMSSVGMKPIIVHGGGKEISREMRAEGIESKFHRGVRITCEKSIQIVERIMKGEVNPRIVAILQKLGAKAQGLHGDKIFQVIRKTEMDKETGKLMDWGFVGEPRDVDTGPILDLLNRGLIPVITPLGMGPDDKVHNINADIAAAAVAKALKARKLAFISDVAGLLRNPEDPSSVITTLKASEVGWLVEQGVIDGGMLPKVQSGVEAIEQGVSKVHIIDGGMPHSLLLEIFTDRGVGTEIVCDKK